jgi:hypothetical protein
MAASAEVGIAEPDFGLHYLRNKEKQEIDFLITRDGEPWLPVEAKLNETDPSPVWKNFLPMIGCPRAIQVVRKPHCRRIHTVEDAQVLVVSASQFLDCLV